MTLMVIPRRYGGSALPALRHTRDWDPAFEDLWQGFGLAPWGAVGAEGFAPRVDLQETEEAYTLTAELPGLEEKDFAVRLEDEVLTLSGEKHTEQKSEQDGWRHVETSAGRFERRFALPGPVDPDAVSAQFKNGLLTVTLPKPPEARPQAREIPVSSG